MSRRTASWLAWLLWALCAALVALGFVFLAMSPLALIPEDLDFSSTAVVGVFALSFATVGALVGAYRPENPIGWIFCAIGVGWASGLFASAYAVYVFVGKHGSLEVGKAMLWIQDWSWLPTISLIGTFLLLLFPDGRLPSRRWRPVAWLAALDIALLTFIAAVEPSRVDNFSIGNPFAFEGVAWSIVSSVRFVAFPLLLMSFLASAASLITRFHRARGEERQQIKWFAYAAAFTGVVFTAAFLLYDAFKEVEILQAVAVTMLPTCAAVAIFRYRLYEIDLLINRTLVYSALTVTLAAVYFGGVATIQTIFRVLIGREEQPQLAIVVSTLVIAALFNPLRRRIQAFIDRRFYRRKYDAAKTLEAFTAQLRDETDLDALSDDLVGVVRETMQPAHVSLWLRPEASPKGAQAD
jgi:hypothetical protein